MKLSKIALKAVSPRAWCEIKKLKRKNKDKALIDAELELYANILQNDHLHYGYFADPDISAEQISLSLFQNAQKAYSDLILSEIGSTAQRVMDVGCGMGGLLQPLMDRNIKVTGLTPNKAQISHIKAQYSTVDLLESRFENIDVLNYQNKFDALICSESLQYIQLEKAFEHAHRLLKKGGKLIIADYFRRAMSVNSSGHPWDEMLEKMRSEQWGIVVNRDITKNILPTLRFAFFILDRFCHPILNYLITKFENKMPGLKYLLDDEVTRVVDKADEIKLSVDHVMFRISKCYMFLVLEKR